MSAVNDLKKELQDLYKSVVMNAVGAVADLDNDGDVIFKYGRLGRLIVICDPHAPNYFRLLDQVDVGAWSERSEFAALKAANSVTMQVKCVMQSIQTISRNGENRLILVNAIEAFISAEDKLPSAEFLQSVFEKYADALDAGRNLFVQEYEKNKG